MARNRLVTGLTNTASTENGAVSNKSTLNAVLDYFYHAPAKRGMDTNNLFADAYAENPVDAILTAFYVRDVRGGAGEREVFRTALNYLASKNADQFVRVLPHIPTYGRWDDVLVFAGHPVVGSAIIDLVAAQLELDVDAKNPSLLAKWMPSENASSATTRTRARHMCAKLGMTLRAYRRMLSDLRKRINVVERLMSAGKFDQIDYSKIPSRAGMLYRKAFHKRDGERYREYLAKLEKGETKINAATLFPYDITHSYKVNNFSADVTLAEQLKTLPDYINGRSILPVCDVSASMFSAIAGTRVEAVDIAVALTLYTATRNKSAFQNMWINFNTSATAYQINPREALHTQLKKIYGNGDWGGYTNLQSVFDLILSTAVRNQVAAEDMPEVVCVVSDMEFNSSGNVTNLEAIRRKYKNTGYTMPKLVFWNVQSRNKQTPALDFDQDVVLVGGASPAIFKSVLNGTSVTPLDLMYEVIHGARYAAVMESLQ